MKRSSVLTLVATLVAGLTPLQAQAPKVSGLVQVWYTQMMNNSLRLNGQAPAAIRYYNLRSEFQENTFAIRRSELKFSGSVTDEVEYEVMIDPSIGTGSSNFLQDAAITWKGGFMDVKVGQMKSFQTWEGLRSSGELITIERAQMTRVFGDVRDRGIAAIVPFGDAKGFGGRFVVGFFNGTSGATAKTNDVNAQKDFVGRVEFNSGSEHSFGFYTLMGTTDFTDKGGLVARTFAGGAAAPTAAQVLDNKDKTSNYGAYYVFQTSQWHLAAEGMTGLLGRRFASVNTVAGAAARQHLDQKFLGVALTAAYTTGNHTFVGRYDRINYNQGNKWYTAFNPYTESAVGVSTGNDFTPTFTEVTVGYLYAFKPEKVKAANFKLNYVLRSKNFLAPIAGQTGEQGGNTLVAAFQVAF